MEFTEAEVMVLRACFQFVDWGNVGFEAIEDMTHLESEEELEAIESLRYKLQ